MSVITIENADDEAIDFLESKIEEALMDEREVDEDFVAEVFMEYSTKYKDIDV